MSSEKKVIDTYYMAQSKWGGYYLAESGPGPFLAQRINGERYLTPTGAKNAIKRYIERWRRDARPDCEYQCPDFMAVKVTVRR